MKIKKIEANFVKKTSLIKQYKKYKYFFIMLLPVLIYYAVFRYGPMYGLVIAFKDYYPLKGIWESPWVGLEHFKKMFSGVYFLPVLRNTLIINIYKLLFGFPAPIILCLLLNEVRNIHFKKTVQTITYLPHFISWVVLASIVIEMLSPSRGPVNYIIKAMGYKPIFFVAEEKWFRTVVVSSSIWKEVGWGTIIYLAAISNIDPELYDVAELDGAGRFRKIFNVTLPCIAPIIVIMLIFSTGNIIKDDFDQIMNLLNAKVMSVGDVIGTYTFRAGLEKMEYGYATAVGMFKNVISFLLVIITNFFAKKITNTSIF